MEEETAGEDTVSHKYNAKATTYNGYRFDSLAEAQRYGELRLLQQAGEIRHLLVHPVYVLQESFTDRDGKKVQPIRYEADFKYVEIPSGLWVVEDVKGIETPVFKIKAKMFKKLYPHMELRVIK